MSKLTKQEKSWVFYDWANSVYSILISTAIFPFYFKAAAKEAGLAAATSTAYWGYANSFATMLISICAPILGTIGLQGIQTVECSVSSFCLSLGVSFFFGYLKQAKFHPRILVPYNFLYFQYMN